MALFLHESTLTERRREAVTAFNRSRRETRRALLATTGSRETRMDGARRLEVLNREQAALTAQARARPHRLDRGGAPRAVVAHRHPWFAERVVELLERAGVDVVAHGLDNGADVVGVVVAEQPDLVMLEDRLLMLPGDEVVRELRRFCRGALVAARVETADRLAVLLEAGADAATTRNVVPPDAVEQALRLLRQRCREVSQSGTG